MNRLVHWSLLLWIPPLAAIGLWSAFIAYPSIISSGQLNPVWISVLGASIISPVCAGVYWLTHVKDLRAVLALAVNLFGLAFNGLGLFLAAGYAAG